MKFETYKISELIDEIAMGPFGSNIKVECFVDDGVPVLNGSNLEGFELGEKSFRYVTEEKADSLGRANAHKGDIVITHRGTLGQIVYIPQTAKYDRYVISQSQFRIKCNKKVLPEYLVYYFHTPIGQYKLLSNASQVGVPALARPSSTFQKIEVEIPDLDTQKQVVAIIQSLQDKIALNNKINDNLEHQVRALFEKSFIKPNCDNSSNLQKTEFGILPESFSIKTVGDMPIDITDYVANGSFATLKANVTLYSERNFAYFIRNTDLKTGNFGVFVDKHSYEFLKKTKLYGGEIIISNVGDVGSVFLCPVLDAPMTLGNNVIVLKPQKEELRYYLYIWFKWSLGQNLIQEIKGGSVQPKFNKSDFKSLPFLVPPGELLNSFHLKVSPMFEYMKNIQIENKNLEMLKNTLLPKLISGEIDVEDVKI